MKKVWTLVIFIIIFIIILSGYVISTALLLSKDVCNSEIIIGAIGEGIAFIGTITLGIVAFWQTKTANDISQTQLRRELISNIVLEENVKITTITLYPRKVLTQFKELHIEGVYCSTKKLSQIDENEKMQFFHFDFQLTIEGAPLENINIKDIKLNQSLSNEYFVDLNILNSQKDIVYVYNPEQKCYILSILINAPLSDLEKLATDKMFVLDIAFDAVSIYGTTQRYLWEINFDQQTLEIENLAYGATNAQNIKLKSVIVKKGEPKYEKS